MYNFNPALSCFIFIASKLLGREGGLELPFKLVINCLQKKKEKNQSPLKCFNFKPELNVLQRPLGLVPGKYPAQRDLPGAAVATRQRVAYG